MCFAKHNTYRLSKTYIFRKRKKNQLSEKYLSQNRKRIDLASTPMWLLSDNNKINNNNNNKAVAVTRGIQYTKHLFRKTRKQSTIQDISFAEAQKKSTIKSISFAKRESTIPNICAKSCNCCFVHRNNRSFVQMARVRDQARVPGGGRLQLQSQRHRPFDAGDTRCYGTDYRTLCLFRCF